MTIENINALIESINEVLRSEESNLSDKDKEQLQEVVANLSTYPSKESIIIKDTRTLNNIINILNLLVNIIKW